MAGKQPDEASLLGLLRAARWAYGAAIHHALTHAGFDDVPRDGAYVIGAIARNGAPLETIIRQLRRSKQAAGQLVDTLVARGYLEREVNPEDRRRLNIVLTPRGIEATEAIRSAVEKVDADLTERVGAVHIRHTRATLAALVEIDRNIFLS